MSEQLEAVRDFTRQVEKTLRTRRLYAPNTDTYKEATARLLEKLQLALSDGDFAWRVTNTELWWGKHSILTCEDRDESFFFPLFRDGLRELRFSSAVNPDELERLLGVFEAEKKSRDTMGMDTVSLLWRADLDSVTFTALDGIADDEGGGDSLTSSGQDDYRYLIEELSAKIKDPAPAETGQSYAFVLDAGVKVATSDMHYEGTTSRRTFEENPTVLRLSSAEVSALRTEVEGQEEGELLDRFVEILFVLLEDPGRPVSMASLAPIFHRLMEGFWNAREHAPLVATLERLQRSAQEAPNRDNRTAATEIVAGFLDGDRIQASFDLVEAGELGPDHAFALWRVAPAGHWSAIVRTWARVHDEQLKASFTAFVLERLKGDPDLLRPMLTSDDPAVVRGALGILQPEHEAVYEPELLKLLEHPDEQLRLKALPSAGRIASSRAVAALWKALEHDPANAVRLLAFRLVAQSPDPANAKRILAVVSSPDFHDRPLFEREKFVRLLARADPGAATRIFSAWIPAKKWLWSSSDQEIADLALGGLLAAGKPGQEAFTAIAQGKGKAAKAAVALYQDLRAKRAARQERSTSS